ncbi:MULTISPECIES: hypothetical protein [unclassified Pseudomonas]|uniref:hypothetical protein n=1 Tax=unclassified Pseudomonas TaxID=196821 RepID=UPI000731163E|nr:MULTISPECIES: hypothetical protein [unclassified Pseudomonas]KSW22796.1 hypothetical protein AOX63_05100 [Pseudomonas sp. ADP]OBP11167.1 hypothetical protein BAE52_10440 [Pseudomonas sp. EGD-AKN5]QOF85616.1 hypothetical protein IG194_02590 [Pseudomonas sp. ADPe]QOF85728.1 hypothetical protein IG194_03220 [Pseudomonas sp. ADPe]
MAKTQQERSAKAAAKRAEVGEEELRHRVRPGVLAKLDDLMRWSDIDQKAEAVQLLILNVHALGPDGAARLLAVPLHEITISESVARRLEAEGRREAAALDRSEQ